MEMEETFTIKLSRSEAETLKNILGKIKSSDLIEIEGGPEMVTELYDLLPWEDEVE